MHIFIDEYEVDIYIRTLGGGRRTRKELGINESELRQEISKEAEKA